MKAPRSVVQTARALTYPIPTRASQQFTRSFITHFSRPTPQFSHSQSPSPYRLISSSAVSRISLTPESSQPRTVDSKSSSNKDQNLEPSNLSDGEYHEIADKYLETLLLKLEELADSGTQKALEVEYSAGVLTVTHPDNGIYVLNKQPPNKQIWLSSPVSGPKRYDWVLHHSESNVSSAGGGMDSKQDTEGATGGAGDDGVVGGGKWIYLRDGTGLSDLLKKEIGVAVVEEGEDEVLDK